MKKNEYHVLGIMSGTSLDGIDIAHLFFEKGESWSYKIISAETIPYPREWQEVLEQAVSYEKNRLEIINKEYTAYLAEVINEFISRNEIKDLDAVCSHGHTIKHEPENGFTLQIGNLPELASMINQVMVCDFRVQDVELGGQGAPLVPIGDELLFEDYEYCLNLGGFANISTKQDGQRIAYDICPVNTVLNHLAEKLGQPYDKDGEIAMVGKLDHELLEELNSKEFYRKNPPKSLGIEWVRAEIFPLLGRDKEVPSLMHTYAVHAGLQISRNVADDPEVKMLVTGGGAYNKFLMSEISSRTKAKVVIPSDEVVNYKEALIFGFLGILRLRREANTLSSVTGAAKDHSSGKIFHP